ncbi:DNA-3-methyladenine glycosylase [Rhodobacteraceae bacterium EhC02]|nr:DNA-3-methyladenine glycosylase [Rhodobacteraceae bacterium EhC02]
MDGRCGWVGPDQIYLDYHDSEWGVPQRDGRALWELLCLEGFQAGLSWITILKRREGFRGAFHGFDPDVIAGWGDVEVARLMGDPRIIRHRGKVEAMIGNAQAFQRIEASGGFAAWVWDHVDGKPVQNRFASMAQVPAQTEISVQLSKNLKRAGFKFCGPTIAYAFMQTAGLVNDHLTGCPRHAEVARMV